MKLVNMEVFEQSTTELVNGYNKMWVVRKTIDADDLDIFNNSQEVHNPVYGSQVWIHYKSEPKRYPLIVPFSTYEKLQELYSTDVIQI